MNITGVVVEYNPFHNGHLLHLRKTTNLTNPDLVIAIMSGNFVQRGEPALFNKWLRTKLALINGVDIVVELPTIYATSSAENFAYGSVLSLEAINANDFVFGAETTNIANLWEIAEKTHSESNEFQVILKENLHKGLSYPQAQQETFLKLYPSLADELNNPNNLLGISYLKAMLRKNIAIKAHSVKRVGSGHHNRTINTITSATAIRENIQYLDQIEKTIPEISFDIISDNVKNKQYLKLNQFNSLIFALLKRANIDELYNLPEMEIGMGELLKNNIYKVNTIEELVNTCTSKRYTSSRIQRIIIRLLLNIDQTFFNLSVIQKELPYIRILGLNTSKSKLIKQWRESLEVPVIQKTSLYKPNNNFAKLSWNLDLRATDIYFNQYRNKSLRTQRQDYTHPLVII